MTSNNNYGLNTNINITNNKNNFPLECLFFFYVVGLLNFKEINKSLIDHCRPKIISIHLQPPTNAQNPKIFDVFGRSASLGNKGFMLQAIRAQLSH